MATDTDPDFTLVRLGHRALLGKALSVPQIRRMLAPIPLREVANTIARISSLIENAQHAENPAVQRLILEGLAPELREGVYGRLNRNQRRRGPGAAPAIMFEDIPLRMAFELALTNVEPAEPFDVSEAHRRILKAILACSDFIKDDDFLPPRPHRAGPDAVEAWAHLEFVTSLARYADASGDGIARAYDILYRRCLAAGGPSALATTHAIRARAGCDLDTFWTLLFALQAQQRLLTPERVATTHAWLSVRSFSTGEFAFPPRVVDRVLNLLARTPEEARAQAEERHARGLPAVYDNSRLFIRPLLRIGDDVCAPVARLLYAKLSFGLHFTLQFLLQEADRERFQHDVGQAFEEYLADTMGRTAGRSGLNVVTQREMYSRLPGSRNTPKICDGIVFDRRRALLWDAKSAYGDGELFGGGRAAFRDYYRMHIERVADQFASTTSLIRSGELEPLGVPRDVEIVGMLMVPWLPLPNAPNLMRYVRQLAAAKQPAYDWVGLSVVHPSVLEGLEACAGTSETILDAFRAYRDSVRGPAIDWGPNNFFLRTGFAGYGTMRNTFLRDALDDLMARMRAVFEMHRATSEDAAE